MSMNDSSPAKPYCYHCGEPVEREQSPCPACGGDLDWSKEAPASEEHDVMNLDRFRTTANVNIGVSLLLFLVAGGFVVHAFLTGTPEAGTNAAWWLVASVLASGVLLGDCAAIKELVAEIERLRSGEKKEESSV
jgi:hypothetical protein